MMYRQVYFRSEQCKRRYKLYVYDHTAVRDVSKGDEIIVQIVSEDISIKSTINGTYGGYFGVPVSYNGRPLGYVDFEDSECHDAIMVLAKSGWTLLFDVKCGGIIEKDNYYLHDFPVLYVYLDNTQKHLTAWCKAQSVSDVTIPITESIANLNSWYKSVQGVGRVPVKIAYGDKVKCFTIPSRYWKKNVELVGLCKVVDNLRAECSVVEKKHPETYDISNTGGDVRKKSKKKKYCSLFDGGIELCRVPENSPCFKDVSGLVKQSCSIAIFQYEIRYDNKSDIKVVLLFL